MLKKQKIHNIINISAIILFVLIIIIMVYFEKKNSMSSFNFDKGNKLFSFSEQDTSVYLYPYPSSERIIQIAPNNLDDKGFSYYNLSVQDNISSTIDFLKKKEVFSFENPLIISNPFGISNNSLYIFFQNDNIAKIDYYVTSDIIETPEPFTRSIIRDYKNNCFEFQIIGVIPNCINTIEMVAIDLHNNVIMKKSFNFKSFASRSNYKNSIKKIDFSDNAKQSDGLYALIGLSNCKGYTLFFDNNGILRYELISEKRNILNLVTYNNKIFISPSENKIASINNIGKIEDLYVSSDYTFHHDFTISDNGKIYVLASKTESKTIYDRVLEINTTTNHEHELLNFKILFKDYYNDIINNGHRTLYSYFSKKLDWIRINSLSFINESTILFSSRETSSIIAIANVFSSPSIKYILSDQTFWNKYAYNEFVYKKTSDFQIHYGQHSANVEFPYNNDKKYDIIFFNNNYLLQQINKLYKIPSVSKSVETSKLRLHPKKESFIYRYTVDEAEKSFNLKKSISVDGSPLVSNVFIYENNYVVNSGLSHTISEYDMSGELIAKYMYRAMFCYRVKKCNYL